jgi:hypothetical protein
LFFYLVSNVYLDEMGRACSVHGGDEKCVQNVGKPEGKRPLRRPCVDERIILKWVLGKQVWRV